MTTETRLTTTWEELLADKTGTVYLDRFDDGVRFLILRGPASLCAYVGVPSEHPLAGHSYDDLPVNCHGGLTYAGEGGKCGFPAGFFWYGWDYSHCDDYATYSDTIPSLSSYRDKGKKWTPNEVEADSWSALWDFRHLVKLSESIANKAKQSLNRNNGTEPVTAAVTAAENTENQIALQGGSAETGGEKAAPELNMTRSDDGTPQFLWFGGKYYTIDHPECMDALLKAIREFPNFPRTSQNQTVASGVEGAHEGTTADKSGAFPELLPTQLDTKEKS